jgi:hypothetical protein
MQMKNAKRDKIVIFGLVVIVIFAWLVMNVRPTMIDASHPSHLVEGLAFPFEFSLPRGLTNPVLKRGDQFYLKTVNGDYVSVCGQCAPVDQNLQNKCSRNLCLKPNPVRSSVFTYMPHRDGTFSVQTVEGKYWKRCANCFERCPGIICADGVNPNLQPAKFVLIKNADEIDSVSIKTDMGRLLEMHDCEQSCGRIVASLGVGLNRQFVIEKLPPPYTPPVRVRKRTKRWHVPSYAPMTIPFH